MFKLCSQTVLVHYGTVRYGKRHVCKQRFIALYHTELSYGTSKYSRVNTSRAGAVSLQVVRMSNCISS